MRLNTLLSFAGFIILIAGTYCPILRPIIGAWDVYDGNKPYGIVILLVAVVGIIGTVFNQENIIRLTSWLSLGLVSLFLVLAWLKVHTSFTFIPLHFVARYLTSKLKFKWGWYLLFGGPILAILGVLLKSTPNFSGKGNQDI
jgi:predicted membrane channel-forming protein YqfA (hemolysin III family)